MVLFRIIKRFISESPNFWTKKHSGTHNLIVVVVVAKLRVDLRETLVSRISSMTAG